MSATDQTEEEVPRIELSENGPLLVKDLPALRNSRGEELPTKKVIALCRCGKSANKPFCDGAHKEAGFQGDKQTDGADDLRDSYEGKEITIYDNRGICAHAAACTKNLASVFRYKQEPWIVPDGADFEAVIAAVKACPSGALSYSIKGEEHRNVDSEAVISIWKDGPYCVAGSVDLSGEGWGHGAAKDRYTLCRCGGSKNKPFCDGSHWDGFKDDDN